MWVVRDVTRDSVIITRDITVIRNHEMVNHKVTSTRGDKVNVEFLEGAINPQQVHNVAK